MQEIDLFSQVVYNIKKCLSSTNFVVSMKEIRFYLSFHLSHSNGTRATHFFLMKHLLKFSVSFTLLFALFIVMASYLLYNDNFLETLFSCIKKPHSQSDRIDVDNLDDFSVISRIQLLNGWTEGGKFVDGKFDWKYFNPH